MILVSCGSSRKQIGISDNRSVRSHVRIKKNIPPVRINTRNVDPDELVSYAETLEGTPYRYGSDDPKKGLDCSGFISYVFQRFGISVPRVSEQFTNAGTEVALDNSKRGDLILFTGSDARSGKVGHMGLITRNKSHQVTFIHSASGGQKGVSTARMSRYFTERFVKVIRVFPD